LPADRTPDRLRGNEIRRRENWDSASGTGLAMLCSHCGDTTVTNSYWATTNENTHEEKQQKQLHLNRDKRLSGRQHRENESKTRNHDSDLTNEPSKMNQGMTTKIKNFAPEKLNMIHIQPWRSLPSLPHLIAGNEIQFMAH
jgi:hypothetical protein